jgi:hypothetical protein
MHMRRKINYGTFSVGLMDAWGWLFAMCFSLLTDYFLSLVILGRVSDNWG